MGQRVYAIGNPFGLDWTLTSGIGSALNRSLNEDDGSLLEHLIQTDGYKRAVEMRTAVQ